ncbi:hypothetical protein DSO57_1002374 [Entomophthora muscae]|uniref:Uncharacterized protein n=1 Tax=Entomophthora muscae TaxID=34485 RepID=A0ACC2RNP6_9FUNG|nr:hypothetical protein DSO57_1002374 [Entomophthora muscae]
MKYSVSLIFASLVYGLVDPDEAPATERFCSVKASVFSIDATFANRIGGPVILTTKNSIDVCKKKSGAKVFRKVNIGEKYKSKPLDMQIDREVAVESVNDLYKDKEFNIYDGIEFIVYNQNKTVVERLVGERNDGQMFSLKMTLDNWNEVGKVVDKYATKIHHVELDVGADILGFIAFKDIVELYPKITFSASNKKHESAIMSVVKDYSKEISRKVGYVIYYPSLHSEVTYTAGI